MHVSAVKPDPEIDPLENDLLTFYMDRSPAFAE
jgi:hypothetical protein